MTGTNEVSIRDVVAFDLDELDFRAALSGLVALVVALLFVGAFGPAGMAAGIAALFVIAGASGDTTQPLPKQAAFVVTGAAVTLAVGYAADSAVAATLVISLVAVLSTLVTLRGPDAAANGAYLLIWAVLTLTIVDSEASPPAMAGAFLIGGALALIVLWVPHRLLTEHTETTTPMGLPRTSIARYAVIRGVGAGLCVALGYWWFPDHAAWAAFAFVLVLRPPKEQAVVLGVGRSIGTVAGVVVGVAIAQLVGDSTFSLLVAFLFCGFAMLATNNVNYAVSTTFTTALLLISQRIIQEDVFSTGWERLGATVVGVLVAFAAIGIMRLTGRLVQDET